MSTTDVAAALDDRRLLVRPAGPGRRRPVLTFIGLFALVALVLLAIGRSGVLAPQAELALTGSMGDGTTTYSLVNHGWRPIEVEIARSPGGVRLAAADADLDSIGSAVRGRIEDVPVFASFTLSGGAHRILVVPIPCVDVIVRPLDLVVRVRSVDTGLVRTLTVDVGEALSCR